MRLGVRYLLIAPLSLTLAGCGLGRNDAGIFCSSDCPNSRQWRDSFCNCVNRPPDSQGGGNNNGGGSNNSNYSASCICNLGEGRYRAWFRGSRTDYSRTISTSLTINNQQCEYLNLCPRHDEPDGGYSYLTSSGPLTMTVTQTGWDDRFGASYIEGRAVGERQVARQSNIMGYLTALAARSGGRALEVQLSDDVLDCDYECTHFGNCTALTGDQWLRQSLGRVHGTTSNITSGTIPMSALMSAFGLSSDPCHRGDLHVGGGRFGNVGSSCTLSANISVGRQPVTVQIDVPRAVEGAWLSRPVGPQMLFDSDGPAPELRFAGDAAAAANLNALYGGRIVKVSLDPDALRLTTQNACLATSAR